MSHLVVAGVMGYPIPWDLADLRNDRLFDIVFWLAGWRRTLAGCLLLKCRMGNFLKLCSMVFGSLCYICFWYRYLVV